MKIKIFSRSVLLIIVFFALHLEAAPSEKMTTVEPYEQFHNAEQAEYEKKLKRLERYLENPANLSFCTPLMDDKGETNTYKAIYKNGFEAILKLHEIGFGIQDHVDTLDIILREVSAFSVAKEIGFRDIAPIVLMKYDGELCEGIEQDASLVVSYFIKKSTHLTMKKRPLLFSTTKKKYDWFNFLVFDCDHEDHNILRTSDGRTFLFDFDWAFSYPQEIRDKVHSQKGFAKWCKKYIAWSETPKDEMPENFCADFKPLLTNQRAFTRLKDYAAGDLPPSLNVVDDVRLQEFYKRANFIVTNGGKCLFKKSELTAPHKK